MLNRPQELWVETSLGPRDYLTLSIGVPKKSPHGRQPPGQSRRPSADLSLVTLVSVLVLPFKWVIRKPYLMTCERWRS